MMVMVVVMLLLVLDYNLAAQHRRRWQVHVRLQRMRVQRLIEQHIAKYFATIVGNFRLLKVPSEEISDVT